MITNKEAKYSLRKSKVVEESSFSNVDFNEYWDHINRLFVSNYPRWSLGDYIDDLKDFNSLYNNDKH